MKLHCLTEDSATSKLVSLMRRAGVDIGSDAARKLIRFASSDRRHTLPTQDPSKALDEINTGRRLASWLDEPVPGLDSQKYKPGYLVFKPENRDVIELLLRTRLTSPVNDLLHGLLFGYEPSSVAEWTGRRAFKIAMRKFLQRHKVGAQPAAVYAGKVTLNSSPRMVPIYKQRLEDAGIKTYDSPTDPNKYNFAIDIPDIAKNINLRVPHLLTRSQY